MIRIAPTCDRNYHALPVAWQLPRFAFNFNCLETLVTSSSADFQSHILMTVLYRDISEVNKYNSKRHFSLFEVDIVAMSPPYHKSKYYSK
jgi:hypothetical protein